MTLIEDKFIQAKARSKVITPPKVDPKTAAKIWFKEMVEIARDNPRYTVEGTLTIELAELLLSLNPDNRPFKEDRIRQMKADIIANAFDGLNGESLKISACGLLNDGQNRCRAVIDAGSPIRTLFVFGLNRESRKTNDQVTPKSSADFLYMDGYRNTNQTATLAGLIWQYETFGQISQTKSMRPTSAQVRDTVRRHSGLFTSIDAIPSKLSPVASLPVLAFVHYVLSNINPRATKDFIEMLVKGTNLDDDDPILLCRTRLMKPKERFARGERIELIFQAWNLWRRGQTQSKLVLVHNLPTLEK